VTLVTGDDIATTTVAGVTIVGVSAAPRLGYHGVFCDRGGAPETGENVGATVLENVAIEAGFHHAILAVSSDSPSPSGCKLRMFDSTVTGALYGMVATGCRPGESGNPISLHVGEVNRGVTFSWIGSAQNEGAGILVQGCVTQSSIRDSRFVDSASGLAIDQRDDLGFAVHPFSVEHNVFTNLTNTGLSIFGNAASAVVNDNTFTNISTGPAGTSPAVALWIEGWWGAGYVPLKKARRNTFIANDVAVFAWWPETIAFGTKLNLDFGTSGDPGENTFLCNAMLGNPTTAIGADVSLFFPGPGVVPLSGNVWDHFPPTTVNADAKANGIDVVIDATPALTVDTSGGRAGTTTCPANRTPGPASVDGGAR
jgi:hypothetical protein